MRGLILHMMTTMDGFMTDPANGARRLTHYAADTAA
jgi:hypothetical protein